MLKTFAPAALALIVLSPLAAHAAETDPAVAVAGTYVNDPGHTNLTMKLTHGGGLSHSVYRFDKVTIQYAYDPAKPAATVVTATIDPASFDAGAVNKQFASEVISDMPGFINAVKFPQITFKSTGIAYTGATGKMTGDLTFMGVTKPVTLDVTYNGSAVQGPRNKMGFSATGSIKRSEYGANRLVGPVGDDVAIFIEAEMVKQ